MNTSEKMELLSIKSEFNSVISELESISNAVRSNFTGIGNDKCSDSIDRVLNQYYSIIKKLNNLDTTTVTESFAQSNYTGED
ncbi:MAG: hypothetical protein R3Y35_12115 [Clostridia bacterium]